MKNDKTLLSSLITETPNAKSENLDLKPLSEILKIMNSEDFNVVKCVKKNLHKIEKVCEIFIETFKAGGRIFFVGAGTSGRLAVQEAIECVPTFGISPRKIQWMIAGGRKALSKSIEGAEDNVKSAEMLFSKKISKKDFIIAISASSITPFVKRFLQLAKKNRIKSALITANSSHILPEINSDVLIDVVTGPEVITGSTRLKAGTATKMILNMITTASMTKLGKVYSNYMVDVKCYSNKLIKRAIRLIEILGQVSYKEGERLLKKARYNTKIAIIMARKKIGYESARKLLKTHSGQLRKIIG